MLAYVPVTIRDGKPLEQYAALGDATGSRRQRSSQPANCLFIWPDTAYWPGVWRWRNVADRAIQTIEVASAVRPLRVDFCTWYVAGVRTQYENVRSVAATEPDIQMRYVEINPYKPGGFIERLPLLDSRSKGTIRSFLCTGPLYRWRSPDVVWTQADTALYLFSQTAARFRHIPIVLSTDATTAQVESMPEYGHSGTSRLDAAKHWVRDHMAAAVYRQATFLLPWSRWAADAIQREYGVPDERVHIIPPGVDPALWKHRAEGWASGAGTRRPTRLLFVGGDFARKGGPLLIEVFQRLPQGRHELHLVTRDAPPGTAGDGIVIYDDLQPNDPRLRQLYETSDIMVLPTRADCFSLAAIEAMAAGMPVIITPQGGIPEIVADGESGLLIPAQDAVALRDAIDTLSADPARMERMGRTGRAIVEERFDARKNVRQVFDLLRQPPASLARSSPG